MSAQYRLVSFVRNDRSGEGLRLQLNDLLEDLRRKGFDVNPADVTFSHSMISGSQKWTAFVVVREMAWEEMVIEGRLTRYTKPSVLLDYFKEKD